MPFWSLMWVLIDTLFFVAYLVAVFYILWDLFSDSTLNGWWKAVWVIFLIFVPFLTALVYVIARGRGMAERAQRRRGVVPEDDSYRPRASANPASDIARAKELLDSGAISQGEFDAIKNKALTGRY
ncbi:SHOCT domain-containing protein [Humibacter ginsenosidimutans]|uniref:SHOCT domain-containing protein n=1 Tax=Humibacter ginsenosidimutans TaxID=2599293 RepID=A0A5B8M2F6_9MICO|nr:SHOCT domain-containing protein [Humibacter ginsenosidimutans]QDZ14271.1 SHOCT domain-containing protein [Humibacter ginsenosidimutans]